MTLYFVTGNKNKYKEAKQVLGDIEHLKIDLPEVQDMDPHEIIKKKLEAAFEHHDGEFIVEDVSVNLECLNGFPGPFIKWFAISLGKKGISDLVEKAGNPKAKVTSIIGYAKSKNEVKFFEGVNEGIVVHARGDNGWGFDPIFQPEGFNKTYAEFTEEEKLEKSHRGIALHKLRDYLKQ